MRNDHSANPGQKKIQGLVAGILLLSWLILGNGGVGVASETPFRLQVQGDRITGVLSQVPLRTVLEKLQQKLAIEYVVPEEELDRLVSANFTGEPVIKALSKILTPWDYALQVDQEGRVHQIFVVAKAEPIEIEDNEVKVTESTIVAFSREMAKSEMATETSKARDFLPNAEMTLNPEAVIVSDPERGLMASPMSIVPSEELPQMVIHSYQGEEMNIQSSTDSMQVIPASGYTPMDILPASEDVRMEFLEGHN